MSSPVVESIRQITQDTAGLCVCEVIEMNGQPVLGRRWSHEGISYDVVGQPVREGVCEPDESVILAFDEFVTCQQAEVGWFTFLHCDGRVVGLVQATSLPEEAAGRALLRGKLDRQLVTLLVSVSPVARSFYAVLSRDGTPKGASLEAPPDWSAPHRMHGIAEACTRVVEERAVHTVTPGYMVKLARLRGDRVDDIIAVFTPVSPARPPELASLTPTQGRVVRFAAAGATVPEIARAMKRSAGTVRTHLREAYRRLDVASRMELLSSSEELAGWGAR